MAKVALSTELARLSVGFFPVFDPVTHSTPWSGMAKTLCNQGGHRKAANMVPSSYSGPSVHRSSYCQSDRSILICGGCWVGKELSWSRSSLCAFSLGWFASRTGKLQPDPTISSRHGLADEPIQRVSREALIDCAGARAVCASPTNLIEGGGLWWAVSLVRPACTMISNYVSTR